MTLKPQNSKHTSRRYRKEEISEDQFSFDFQLKVHKMTATGQLMLILNALYRNLVESTNIYFRKCNILMEVLV
jgi:hypothetical protein